MFVRACITPSANLATNPPEGGADCQVVPAGADRVAGVNCPAGTTMTGGGFSGHHVSEGAGLPLEAVPADLSVTRSAPSGNGWQAQAGLGHVFLPSGEGADVLTVYAVCATES